MPAAVVASRLLLDPVVAGYYWVPVKVLGLVAVASFLALRDERGLAVVPLLYPALLLGLLPHWVVALVCWRGSSCWPAPAGPRHPRGTRPGTTPP